MDICQGTTLKLSPNDFCVKPGWGLPYNTLLRHLFPLLILEGTLQATGEEGMAAVLHVRWVRRTPDLRCVLRMGWQSPLWLRAAFCRLLRGAHGSAKPRSELPDGDAELQGLAAGRAGSAVLT